MRPATVFLFVVLFCPSVRADWPMARHDARRTAVADGVSNITAPVPFWRYFAGGSIQSNRVIAHDVDGDGEAELLIASGGRIVAKRPNSGDIVWESKNLEIQAITALTPLDGGADLMVTRSSRQVHILDPANGSLVWSEPPGEMGTIGAVRLGDLDGDGHPDLVVQECGCCGVNSGQTGFVYSFAGAAASPSAPRLLWQLPSLACGGGASATIVHTRSPVQAEFVNGTATALELLDGASGTLIASTAAIGTNVQTSRCLPIDVDGGQEELLCVLNSTLGPAGNGRRLFLLRREGSELHVVWEQLVGEADNAVVVPPSAVADLDGDGELEVIASGRDAQNLPTAFLFSAASGSVLGTVEGHEAAGSVELSPSRNLMLTRADRDLHAWSYLTGAGLTHIWSLPDRGVTVAVDRALSLQSSFEAAVLAKDVSQDGALDLLTLSTDPTLRDLRAHDLSGSAPAMVVQFSPPPDVAVLTAWGFGPDAKIALAQSDGNLHVLNSDWEPVTGNKEFGARFGGYYSPGTFRSLRATPILVNLDDSGPPGLLVQTSRGTVERLDATKATFAVGPQSLWSRGSTIGVVAAHDGEEPTLFAIDVGEEDDRIVSLRPDGNLRWSSTVPGVTLADLVVGNFDGDGRDDVLVQWGGATDGLESQRTLSGSDGSLLWNAPPHGPFNRQPAGAAAADWDADGLDDVLYQADRTVARRGLDGSILAESDNLFGYAMPHIVDADGDGQDEVVLHGTFVPARAFAHDLSSELWVGEDDRPLTYAATVLCPGGGQQLVGGSWSQPSRLKVTEIGGPAKGSFRTMVLAGGAAFVDESEAEAAGVTGGQLGSPTAHTNLSGDGRVHVLVGSTDGWLYAVDPCTTTLLFSVNFDAPVGSAVFGDTDGDGLDEIIVSVADGYLYALKQAVPSVQLVLDTDPPNGILTEDVDEIETHDTLYAAWESVEGAESYEAAAVRDEVDGGGFITEPAWVAVGSSTTVELSDLPLEDDHRYFIAVRAIVGGEISSDRLSDGVLVRLIEEPPPQEPDPGLGPVYLNGRSCVYFCAASARGSAHGWLGAIGLTMLLVGRRWRQRRRSR